MKCVRTSYLLAAVAVLVGSLWLSYQLRFDFSAPAETQRGALLVFLWVISLKLFGLWRFRQFQVLLAYFSIADFSGLFWALFTPGLFVFGISSQLGLSYAPPRGVVLADFSFSVIGLTLLRLLFRGALARRAPGRLMSPGKRARRAGIIGAGLVGTTLAQEFANRKELGLQAVAFFDDDRSKWGRRIQNVPVAGAPEVLLDDKLDLELEEVIIAMPSAPAKRVAEIVRVLQQLKVKFRTVPSFYELTTGQAKVSQLRSVEIQDLLGREQVHIQNEDIQHILRDQIVMVTGAGGSIGSELCRQVAGYSPRRLLLVEQSEVQLFQIEQDLINSGYGKAIVPLLANILDEQRLDCIFQRYHPQVVFHAAAHKHVPMMESQPGEAVKNNALGTLRLAETCLKHRTDRFVLISSDKAINPTNVMGATKRLAEMCVQSIQAPQPGATRFMAVRFGNVLGSSGSVVPIFNKQIAAGGPVKVTHPEVTRYFMTIPEAVGLVLKSAALGSGGEIFTLDMGKPVRILDLARQLIELSGLIPDQDIKIEFTGLRPGEKLFEELSYRGERISATCHPKIMQLLCEPLPFGRVRSSVLELVREIDRLEPEEFKCLLKYAVPEYQPQLGQPAASPLRQRETPVPRQRKEMRNGNRPSSEFAPGRALPQAFRHERHSMRSDLAMRILAITNIYPTAAFPARGVFVQEQIKGLRAIGVEVRLLFVNRRQEGPLAYYRLGSKVRNAVAEFEPDAIHVMYGGVMADQIVRRHHLRPVVVTFHGSDLLGENLSGWVRRLISRYGVYCSRRAAKTAEGVIVVARHLVGALNGTATAGDVRVIPCGIDLERFKPMDPLVCKRRLGWSTQSFHVLFASSNGDPVKRPELARAAVAQMSNPDCPSELHCLTATPNAEVPVWLNASDVLLLTSMHEGSPTIVKEALACGLPVVSVDVGDVAERVEGIEGCYMARPEAAELAAKLCLVQQRGKRLDCRTRLEVLSTVSVAQKLKGFYEAITRKRRALPFLAPPAPLSLPAVSPVNRDAASADW